MTIYPHASNWIQLLATRKTARVRLFCLPHAGSGASVFQTWLADLPDEVQLSLIQLPGREDRYSEPPFEQLEKLIEHLGEAIRPYLDLPFAFFGHSVGALICFELIRYLRLTKAELPIHLFVAGFRAPQLPDRWTALHNLPRATLISELRRLEGTPEKVLQNDEIFEFFLPILRADFSLAETYKYMPGEPLNCPITAFGGLQDIRVDQKELALWSTQTTSSFKLFMVQGNHFFIYSGRHLFLPLVVEQLNAYLFS